MKAYKVAGRVRRSRLSTWFKRGLVGLLLASIVTGGYLGLLVLSPQLLPILTRKSAAVNRTDTVSHQNRIYIPILSMNLPYNVGDASVLSKGAWYRFPERGSPATGGNFILAGHRFKLGLTPYSTKDSSPFYHLNLLTVGDKIYIDFNGRRYEYSVTRNYTVAPTETEIEAPSKQPKMTLYTCTLKGSSDGREVVNASLVAKDIPIRQLF